MVAGGHVLLTATYLCSAAVHIPSAAVIHISSTVKLHLSPSSTSLLTSASVHVTFTSDHRTSTLKSHYTIHSFGPSISFPSTEPIPTEQFNTAKQPVGIFGIGEEPSIIWTFSTRSPFVVELDLDGARGWVGRRRSGDSFVVGCFVDLLL